MSSERQRSHSKRVIPYCGLEINVPLHDHCFQETHLLVGVARGVIHEHVSSGPEKSHWTCVHGRPRRCRRTGFPALGDPATAVDHFAPPLVPGQADAVNAYRDAEFARLDALLAAVWEDAVSGNMAADDRVLKVIAARCRLLGLDQTNDNKNGASGATHVSQDSTGPLEIDNASPATTA